MPEPRDPVDEGFGRLRQRGERDLEGVTPPEFVERIVDGALDEGERPAAARALLYDRSARDRALDFLAADIAMEREAGGASGAVPANDNPARARPEPGDGRQADGSISPRPSTLRRAWPWLATGAAAALILVVVRTWFGGPPGAARDLDLRGYLVAVASETVPPKSVGAGSPLRAMLRVRLAEQLRLATREGQGLPAEGTEVAAVALRLDRAAEPRRRRLSASGTVAVVDLADSGPGVYVIAFGTREAGKLEKSLRAAAVGPQEVLARGEGMAAAQGALEAALASEQGATDALYVLVEVVP